MRRTDAVLALTLVACATTGCDWFNTMSRTPEIQPHEVEPIAPPPHAVPINGLPAFDLTDAAQVLGPNPQPADSASLAIGEAYFVTFCAPCHGATGLGNGPVSKKFPAVPAIVTDKVAGYDDAYIFALVSQGRGLMPDYGRIPRAARWDIVNYLRSLRTDVAAGGAPDSTAGGSP